MQAFLYVWREFSRQKANLFFTVFFPSILVFILGTLLEQWNIAEYEIPDIHVAYVAQESYPAFEMFLEEAKAEGMLNFVTDVEKEAALAEIDTTFSGVIEYDAEGRQLILHQGTDAVVNRAMHITLQSYASLEEAVMLCYENGVQMDMTAFNKAGDYVIAKKLGVERSMIDYYAVCMLVMILFMGGTMSGGMQFYEFRTTGLFRRTGITPVNKVKLFVQMLLGNIPGSIIEIVTIMFCSVFFFGGHYCADFLGNAVLFCYFFLIALTVSAVGAVVGLCVNVNPTAILMPVSWVILFFSGSFANIYIEGVTNLMPAYQIQQAAFDLTLFGNYEKIFLTGGVAALCLFGCLVLGSILFCRKKEV